MINFKRYQSKLKALKMKSVLYSIYKRLFKIIKSHSLMIIYRKIKYQNKMKLSKTQYPNYNQVLIHHPRN